tara:strand:- start:409 stop:816 length:408 start_codon:yes stop_codon:yes gene_type:complete
MVEDFYYDTSIWIDFHEKRGDNGKLALKLILKIINEDLKIAYSDLNVKEFKILGYSQEEIDAILGIIKPNNIKHVHIYKEQIEEARKIARKRNVPRKDALHAIIARDNDLQLIATDSHYEQLRDITKCKKPIDVI